MNYETIHFFSQSLTTIIINIIVFMFFWNVYHTKYKNKTVYILTFIVWTVVMFWVNSFNIGILNLIFFFVTSELICIILFDTNFKKSWLYNALIMLFLLFNDIMTYIIWSAAYGKSAIEIADDSNLLIISNLLNVLLSFVEYKILVASANRSVLNDVQKQELVFLLFMTSIECYIAHFLFQLIENNYDSYITLVILTTFLIFNIYVTYIIRKVADLYKYKYDMELMTRQSAMQFEQYKEMEQTYEEARYIIHDMKRHLLVLDDLNDFGNSRGTEYSLTLEKQLETLFSGFQCSNQILSIIIGRKIKLAENKNILVKIDVEDINIDFIEDLDVTGIFANLWDNAIEACEDIDDKNRKILFVMNMVNGFIIVNMENTYNKAEYMKLHKNSVKTTKKNHMGVGLSVIKNTVEKYNGLLNIITDEEKFVIEITIPVSN